MTHRSDSSVTIGPGAFRSSKLLDSVLFHESVHVEQNETWYYFGSTNLREVQAYDATRAFSISIGASPEEVSLLYSARADYYNQLSAAERWRVRQ